MRVANLMVACAVTTATIPREAYPGSQEELRARLAAAVSEMFPESTDADDYTWAYVAATYDDYVVACVVRNGVEAYYRIPYTVDGERVALGMPEEVQPVFVPAEAREAVSRRRRTFDDGHSLSEAAFDNAGRTLQLTIIQAGFNTSRSRYYTESALRSGVRAFRGRKQYLNHQTRSEERERPEGDLNAWVASLVDVRYDEASRSLKGTAKIVDPQFLEKVALLDEQGLLSELGVSIRAIGAGEEAEIEGVRTFRVDTFVEGISVDFVTEPGAGGFVMSRESATPTTEESNSMSAEAIAAAERRAAESEQRARELQAQLDAANARAAAAESALEEMRAQEARREAQAAIGQLIAESNLPEPSQNYLRTALAEETDAERARALIETHRQYVESLLQSAGGSARVSGMGDSMAEAGGTTQPVDISSRLSRVFGLGDPPKGVTA